VIEAPQARLLTIVLLPLVPCTARLAVVAFMTPVFFGVGAPLVALGLVGGKLFTALDGELVSVQQAKQLTTANRLRNVAEGKRAAAPLARLAADPVASVFPAESVMTEIPLLAIRMTGTPCSTARVIARRIASSC
jgi:hypothetical protein